MHHLTREFLLQARSGRPLYLPQVRDAFAGLSPEARFDAAFFLTCIDGTTRRYTLPMPRFADCDGDERRFVLEFVLAQIFNMLSCLGGRELACLFSEKGEQADAVFQTLENAFGLGQRPAESEAYGGAIRVVNRMLAVLPIIGGKTQFSLCLAGRNTKEKITTEQRNTHGAGDGAADILARSAEGLEGKTILGVDIGGTDVKIALSVNGRLRGLKEYDWFPTRFTSAEEFIHPLRVLVRLMSVAAGVPPDGGDADLRRALAKNATLEEIETALSGRPEAPVRFDAIGLSFPDVVVADRIVGGESPKTLGMRQALGKKYDAEFSQLTCLACAFKPWMKREECVFIVNDGPMAAFAAGVEMVRVRPDAVERGVLAHTLGTDFGSGWVTGEGRIPDLPMDVYNCILDLGSYPEREFPPEDVRSINNFNSGLPGTMQKFAGQSGVFRLAEKSFPSSRPDVYASLLEKGFIVKRGDGLFVPTEPHDMRKPFLEYMMELVEGGTCPEAEEIFREVGRAVGMVSREMDWLLRPGLEVRTLFGRLVKVSRCFELMREGALEVNPGVRLEAADEGMANTPLMRELAKSDYTVAQFGQAVGAVHYANSRLNDM